jgi:hypothetical protein
VNDIYKVKTMIDIPQSLINAYVKKVKDTTGKNLRQFFGDVDIAEEIVKFINMNNLDVEKIPGNAIMGGQVQAQTTQSQPEPQAQTEVQTQSEVQIEAQPEAQVQTEAQPQVQTESQPQGEFEEPQAQGQEEKEEGEEAQGQAQGQEETEEGEEELPV